MTKHNNSVRGNAWVAVILSVFILIWIFYSLKLAIISLIGEVLLVNFVALVRGKRFFDE